MYAFETIEQRWQERWKKDNTDRAEDRSKKQKAYVLIEFPYPSGDGLHVGHVRSYAALDVVARKKRMEGKNVLFPIGWDAFGLPTENYALKTGRHPVDITKENIATFERQMRSLGLSFDWSRVVNTTDPKYYKWTQWIFLQLLKKGLAYQAEMPINWCPKDKIGLANEEVVQGKCERCGTGVVKKLQKQWMLKITAYAERLLNDLETVDYLPHIKEQQKNWIGKSEGLVFASPVKGMDMTIETFSTHFEAFFADTFVVIAPDHPLLPKLVDGLPNAQETLAGAHAMVTKRAEQGREEVKEVEGIFTGRYTLDPIGNGELPIWIANFALADYGTGIIKCSAHDERDFAFAKKYGIPLKEILEPVFTQRDNSSAFRDEEPTVDAYGVIILLKHWNENKYLALKWKEAGDWGTFLTGGIDEGMTPEDTALKEIREETGYANIRITRSLGTVHGKYYHVPKKQNRIGHSKIFVAELTDGARSEIDAVEATRHELLWLTVDQLQDFLTPDTHKYALKKMVEDFPWTDMKNGILNEPKEFAGKIAGEHREAIADYAVAKGFARKTITYKLRDWVFSRQHYWGEPIPVVHCKECGVVPVPEKNLPVELPHVEKYQPTDTGESPLATITDWVNTKCPKCGGPAKRETDTMPNWAGSSWYYLRYCDPHNDKKFADKKKLTYWLPVDMYNGGMEHTVLHLLYSRFWHKFLFDEGLVPNAEPYNHRHSHGIVLGEDGRKMSKSFGNVVNPDDLIKEYGADSLRLYELFMGPYEDMIPWSHRGIVGCNRFLNTVSRLFEEGNKEAKPAGRNHERLRHATVKRVTEDIDGMHFNTAVSALMEYVNAMKDVADEDAKKTLLQLLFPMAPHIASELWEKHFDGDISEQPWPAYDETKLQEDTFDLIVQVNGKVRGRIPVSSDIEKDKALTTALADANVKKFVTGNPEKVVFVKGKLLNIVTE